MLAERFGFASILGAFAAGLLVRAIDLTGRTPHPQFQVKLEGIGFGFLIPVFFIATGVQFDVRALVSNPQPSPRSRCSCSRCWWSVPFPRWPTRA